MNILVAPLEALTDAMLSDPERRVLLALFSYRGKVTELVFPSLEALSERSNISDKTRISKITTSLAKKGWLTKKKRGFTGCNQYTMCMPERLTNLDLETNLALETNLVPDTNSNLDSDTNYDLGLRDHVQVTNQLTNQINKPIKTSSKAFIKPSVDELTQFIFKHGEEEPLLVNPAVYANEIFDHYESNGWKVGKNAMKNWKAATRSWINRNQKNKTNGGYSNGTNQQQPGRITSSDRMRTAANELVQSLNQAH